MLGFSFDLHFGIRREGFQSEKIRVPSFHTWGEADKEIDASRSIRLADTFRELNTMPHQGEHLVRGVEFWPTD